MRRGRDASAPRLEFIDEFEIWVIRKNVKRINLHVRPGGRLEASIPRCLPFAELEAFVRNQADWIRNAQAKAASSTQARAEEATDEERREWRLVVEAFVPLLIERWEPLIGVRAARIVYRDMRSRWGSCQPSTGRICINIRLALYPPECLEYVVVHELCHLRERGHGRAFKALMDMYLPDWRELRKRLHE